MKKGSLWALGGAAALAWLFSRAQASENTDALMRPVDGVLTSGWGTRWLNGRWEGHNGADYGVDVGTPIYSPGFGVVVGSSCDDINGGRVIIDIPRPDGTVLTFIFLHMSERYVRLGDRVSKGDVLGLSGGMPGQPCAGQSTGPHVHVSLKVDHGNYVDPLSVPEVAELFT